MRVEKSTLIATLALALLTASLNAYSATRVEQESEQAAQAYQAKNFQEAASHFQRVVQIDPSNAKAWLFLGQSLAQINDNMGARKAFAKVLALQSSGQVADRAREQFGKLPDPDLFTLQLDSGLTLGDWMPLAEKQITNGKRENVLQEIGQHLKQFGPVPQLLVMQEKLLKETQAESEKQLQQAIAAIKVSDAETAKTALPHIRQLKRQMPSSLKLMQMEAKACHLTLDFACAEAAYSAWLKTASRNDSKRKQIVAALMQAKQHEALLDLTMVLTNPRVTGEVIRDCSDCPEMVVISDGTVQVGGAGARRTVTFEYSFAIGKTEVTQGQWKAIMGSNPSQFSDCGDACPVENVSWNDAQEFIRKLNAKTGKQYRLPSESEWEVACRGGVEQNYCGSDDVDSVAWYSDNSDSESSDSSVGKPQLARSKVTMTGLLGGAFAQQPIPAKSTHPAGKKFANAFGLYDMSGNVMEWVQDCANGLHAEDGSAREISNCDIRVIRGGSWGHDKTALRAIQGNSSDPKEKSRFFGFRLARTIL